MFQFIQNVLGICHFCLELFRYGQSFYNTPDQFFNTIIIQQVEKYIEMMIKTYLQDTLILP